MAQEVVIIMRCDMPGDKHAEEVDTHTLVVDGRSVELDLCATHGTAFSKATDQFLEAGRSIRPSRPRALPSAPGRRTPTRRDAGYKEQLAAIRSWAKQSGKEVSDRGRIPDQIVREYELAHA